MNIIRFSIILFFLASCSSDSIEKELLYDDFYSYSSIRDVKKLIKRKNFSLDSENIEKYPARGKCGIFEIKTLKYKTLNSFMIFTFYNQRLSSIALYPLKHINLDKIENKLKKNKYGEYIIYYKAKDYKNKIYFEWIDKRLKKEYRQWIQKCS